MVNTVGDGGGNTYIPPPIPQASFAISTVGAGSGTGSRTAARTARVAAQDATAIADASGTVLAGNDELGFGLDRPYLGLNIYATAEETTPTKTTVNGTFENLWTVSAEPQHPKWRVRVRVVNGAGTAGEVRLVDRATGTVISSILVVGSAATVEQDIDGTLFNPVLKSSGGVGVPMKVDVQARRTGGANTVAVLVLHVLGKGT